MRDAYNIGVSKEGVLMDGSGISAVGSPDPGLGPCSAGCGGSLMGFGLVSKPILTVMLG
jgi:hypothetical protein